MMLKGMTAQYLIQRTYKVKKGDTVLFHAAAGGVGLIACQWAQGARRHGDRHGRLRRKGGARQGAWLRPCDRLHARGFRRAGQGDHQGKGVPVVYDAVGKDTLPSSLDCLRAARPDGELRQRLGSGAADQLRDRSLARLAVFHAPDARHTTRPTRRSSSSPPAAVRRASRARSRSRSTTTYPLKDAAQAHRDLEARKTTGSIVLMP